MSGSELSLSVFFVGTAALVLLSVEIGFRFGRAAHRRSEEEKESPVAMILALSLALVISLIVGLDRPTTSGFLVSQQPLVDVQSRMAPTHDELQPDGSN